MLTGQQISLRYGMLLLIIQLHLLTAVRRRIHLSQLCMNDVIRRLRYLAQQDVE